MNTKPKILLWPNDNPTNTYTLRINDNRYIGLIRTDRRGKSYWNFKEFAKKPIEGNNNSDNSSNSNRNLADSLEKLIKDNELPINQPNPN